MFGIPIDAIDAVATLASLGMPFFRMDRGGGGLRDLSGSLVVVQEALWVVFGTGLMVTSKILIHLVSS